MGRDYFTALLPSIGMQYVGGPMLTQGQSWFVRPGTGSDGYKGNRPDRALKTIYNGGAGGAGALAVVTANRNDVVYLMAESNTAASTTDYQSYTTGAALTWDKDLTHLVGVGAGNAISQRSRIALLSTFNTAVPMVDWSASGCHIANIQFYQGVAHANPTGCVKVSGARNRFFNCHFAGLGDTAGNNDIDNAYSLWVTGAENLFENCVIGLDTADRGATSNFNYEVLLGPLTGTGSAARNIFRNCVFISRLTSATKHPFIGTVVASPFGDPSFALFDNCKFIATSTNYGYAQTYVVKNTAALTAGSIVLANPTGVNVSNWAAAGNHVYVTGSATLTGYNQALGYAS